MDLRMILLPVISMLLFALCLGGVDPEEGSKTPGTTQKAVSGETKAEATTTLFVLPTEYVQTPSSILPNGERTTIWTTTTKKVTTTTISSSRGCSRCRNSNLSCSETVKDNGTDVICTCINPLSNGEYASCYLSRGVICTSCYEGTACGQNNAKGSLCRCDQKVGEGMYLSCFLGKPKCTKCDDGTACGDAGKNGKGCFCYPGCQGVGCEYDLCELK